MAIDSRAKRVAMLNFGVAGASRMPPWPDGSIDTADRWHFLGLYEPQFLPISGAEYAFIVGAVATDFVIGDVATDFILPDIDTDFEDGP